MLITNLPIFIAALSVLIISGTLMVKSLSKIAAFLHISEYVVGFILLAFATSLPELFVGISSAINKTPEIVVGTVIGSNIANLTLIIGIPVLLAKGIRIHSKKTKTDSLFMIGLSILPLLLMILGNKISRIDGVILLLAFSLYVFKLIKEGKHFKKELENDTNNYLIIGAAFLFLISLVALYFSSGYVVEYAQLLAIDFSIPAIFIGLFMVAVGTSLPELVSGLSAVTHGHHEMGIGNIIGSVIANATLVLGVSSIIFPITNNIILFIISGSFMILTTIIFTAFVEQGDNISWMEGLALVMLYIFFIIVEFYLKGFI